LVQERTTENRVAAGWRESSEKKNR